MPTTNPIIAQTKNWLQQVVIACNFCPFAKKELHRGSIHFEVVEAQGRANLLASVVQEMQRLDENDGIETTLLIYPEAFPEFAEFLDFIELAETELAEHDYEGIYQLATFHPDYCFVGEPADDPANFTNRSLYPMLHILREASITKAVDNYPDPENIPERNIVFARKKGLAHMAALREACRNI